MQAHSHNIEDFREALKIFIADVYSGEPEALKIADIIIHFADMGDNSAIQLCALMNDICENTQFIDLRGNQINIGACACGISIGACCASCAKGGPCQGAK